MFHPFAHALIILGGPARADGPLEDACFNPPNPIPQIDLSPGGEITPILEEIPYIGTSSPVCTAHFVERQISEAPETLIPSSAMISTTIDAAPGAYAPEPGDENRPYCSFYRTDDPHWSIGANGIIVKGHTEKCFNTSGYKLLMLGLLYLCPDAPGTDELRWSDEGCVLKKQGVQEYDPVNPDKNTVHAPKAPEGGARGTGYWIGCTIAEIVNKSNGVVAWRRMFAGRWVWITAT